MISIIFLRNNKNLDLIIKDNGPGFDNTVLNYKTNSIGIDLIKGLTKQIEGKVTFSNNNGAQVMITFKVPTNNI